MPYIRHNLYKYLVWAIITFLIVTIGLHSLSPKRHRDRRNPTRETPSMSQELEPASPSAR